MFRRGLVARRCHRIAGGIPFSTERPAEWRRGGQCARSARRTVCKWSERLGYESFCLASRPSGRSVGQSMRASKNRRGRVRESGAGNRAAILRIEKFRKASASERRPRRWFRANGPGEDVAACGSARKPAPRLKGKTAAAGRKGAWPARRPAPPSVFHRQTG